MRSSWVVFVEGKADAVFVRCLLQFLDMDNVAVQDIGGGIDKLKSVAPEIRRSRTRDDGNRVAIILDANSHPQNRGKEFENKKTTLGLPIERAFLMPNDDKPGRLETLLEQIAAPAHQAIYGCFDTYENCLRDLDEKYTMPPGKARIYAYCEAIGAKTHPKHREYDRPEHWNLEAPALEPLKKFLRGLT